MGKRVFITGIGGFIGGHLAQRLAEAGFVVGGSYFRPTNTMEVPSRYAERLYNIDVRYRPHIEEALADFKPDVIYHLAAQSYPMESYKFPSYTVETNVLGTLNLFESVIRTGLSSCRIMLASSTAAYGFIKVEETPVGEDQPFRPAHVYGMSKAGQDLLGDTYFRAYGLDIIRLRIGNCVGPRRTGEVVSDFTYRRALWDLGKLQGGFPVGNLHTKRAFLDVRDAVEAFLSLQEKGKSGEAYNVAGEKAFSIKELLDLVLEDCPQKPEVVTDPSLVREVDEPIYWSDLTKLKEVTGWFQKIPLRKTVKDMVDWWKTILSNKE
jgi:GDPmannose 4,6-dehydratase/GDP-4-dehydro-6-deoxy-D-mannose reductase